MATKKEVREFLDKFRMVAGSPKRLILLRSYPGSKNSDGLLNLGMTEAEAKGEIFRLRTEDYSAGPEDDRDKPGQKVWKFAPIIRGHEVYVKLILTADGRAKVLSFHPPEYPMPRPFQNK